MSAVATSTPSGSRLMIRQEVAERTVAILFEKSPGWTFNPGQFVDMTLLDPPQTDFEGKTRAFSMASALGTEEFAGY